jgi:hypothetical protein
MLRNASIANSRFFFGCNAAYIDDGKSVPGYSPARAQLLVVPRGIEEHRVHGAGDHAYATEAPLLQPFAQFLGRHNRGARGVMHAAQPMAHDGLQQAESVGAGIGVEARMKAGGDRNAEAARSAHGRPAERTFRRDVNGIRSPRAEAPV